MKRKLLIIMSFLLAFTFTACGSKKKKAEEQISVQQMQQIGELATLDCYYHNVAKSTKKNSILFLKGKTKLWIEYTGKVKVGIDATQIKMKIKGKKVIIAVPDAKVLSVTVDQASLENSEAYVSEQDGLVAKDITAEDQSKAFEAAQDYMEKTAREDTALMFQAKERAKTLLKNYVENIGNAMGTEYEVEFKDLGDMEEPSTETNTGKTEYDG